MNKLSLLFISAALMAPLAATAQDATGYEVQESVKFARNSSTLSKEAAQELRVAADSLSVLLRYRPESSVEIAGYAESGEKKPGPLADARAQKVWEFLIAAGLPAERMEPVGYGASGAARASSRVDVRIASEDALAMTQIAQPMPAPAPEPAPYEAPPAAVTPPVETPPVAATTPSYTPPPSVTIRPAEPPRPPMEDQPGADWSKNKIPASTPESRAAEQRRLKAEQQEAPKLAREQAEVQKKAEREAFLDRKKADQAAMLERRQAAGELRKAEQVAALERKQAEAELRRAQREEARLQAAQNAAEKKRMQEQEAMRVAMAQPAPTLTPEAPTTDLKSAQGKKIVDNQTNPSYTRPPSAATPKSALPGEGSYFIQGTAYFSANARSLTPGSSGTLDALAIRLQKLIQSKPSVRVDIVGHADPLTEGAQADVLAEGRAEELVKELSARGVDRSRLRPAGAADTQPLTSKKGDPARNLNMRAEIRVPN